ncbi:hypothetical protein [Neorhizobium sp. P12A]|uniref:hypothetical protein n=1 Tax=Neorhizobium sp. P12A TaxID=2268027 RepID=UPI0011EF4899|nr:hypothetical protein [Neorhizobium sp. P12A]
MPHSDLPAPYTDVIDAARTSNVRHCANVHGLTLRVALDLIRATSRHAADEAALTLKSHFTQSIPSNPK